MSEANPVLIEVCRGAAAESRHRGAAVIADANGRIVAGWGDFAAALFPRSAIKPLQALACLEAAVVDRYATGAAEIAIACGSHRGEPLHVACVEAWLARIGCREADLVCGPHPPAAAATANALIQAGEAPRRLHNNCSGKHAGILAACRDAALPTSGYERVDHPLQAAMRRVLSEMGETDIEPGDAAVDGCGLPTPPMPLSALALAFARLAVPRRLAMHRAAAERVVAAMTAHPMMVSGSGGFDTRIIAAGRGTAITKGGAEGVHAAALPEQGLGIAVKIDDGAKRAAEAAMAALIRRFGRVPTALAAVLDEAARPVIHNTLGRPVGEIRPAAGWLD